ncbi:MAG: sulfatase [Acidobacteria bacterium]|nr:sulfatase [Acidobacteriota bacterium]
MRRREFVSLAAAPAILRSQQKQRPNIAFFFADDWGRYASVYREGWNSVVRTPHIDRVAREGILFTNAFMATPSCTPSRAAVSTGCYSFRCGAAANLRGGSWKGRENPGAKLPGFGRLLEANGYHVRNHFKTLTMNWLGGESYGRLDSFHRYSQYVSAAGSADEARQRKAAVVEQAKGSIRRVLGERGKGQPFFYVYGPINTHRPWVRGSGRKLWDIDPDALQGKMPSFLPDVPEVREDVADYLGEVQALDLMVGAFLEELDRSGERENTLVVLSGDNGMPGVPRGKCNLYDLGVRAPLMARWPARIRAGLSSSDFVNLMDLAPTFLEAAGLAAPVTMNGRSLVGQFDGKSDATREYVVTSRERHVPDARAGSLPYPSRAIRTREFLYIRNFKPERMPMGDAVAGVEEKSYEFLATNHELLTYKDMDESPTKAWILKHRREAPQFYDTAFGRRPAEELYDLRSDAQQMRNVAGEARYASQRAALSRRLMGVLESAGDPRLQDAFDRPPYIEEGA